MYEAMLLKWLSPGGLYGRNEVLDQLFDENEHIVVLAPANVVMVAFAALVVEANQAHAIEGIGSAALEAVWWVGGTGCGTRQTTSSIRNQAFT